MLAGAINTNVNALFALNALQNTSNTTSSLEQQLSSGLAINGPQDNPAGYIAAQGFTSQIGGTQQAISNANQAISLVQTANGAITQQVNILQQMQTIADQAANGLNSAQQLQSLQQVVSQLQTQVTTIAQQSVFNGLNLLDGSFSGVQFQVGASQGQIIQLSIGSTLATQLGVNQSSASAAGLYHTDGAGSGGVGDVGGSSYAITSGGVGAFTAGSFGVSGSAGAKSVSVTATESAKDVAASINAVTSNTNVSAAGTTSVAFTVTAGSFSFVLGNGNGGSQTNGTNIAATVTSVSQSGLQSLVNAVNQETGTTGITATVNSSNQLVLTQAQGDNISFTGFATGAGAGSLAAGGTSTVTLGGAGGKAAATVQGVVTLQSNQTFALSAAASDVGLNTTSSLTTLGSANVSTISGANSALNVVSFALQQLENIGAQLGAVQQRLQATASNLQTTNTNLTAARSVVQDANIPQVTTQLTQQQILQQAGVSALAQSSALEQSFLKLLQ